MDTFEFQELIWQRGRELYRDMPWRSDSAPYRVWVSELMLQQTQVARVIPKFEAFMYRYPTLADVANSSLADVLVLWSGLGYNRRAQFLWQAAKRVCSEYGGSLPSSYAELVLLPGIGPNTAAAIMNYAYQVATPFVETNIRTVYFHHFFHDKNDITDKEILALVELTIDREGPREWFWALMDYGAHLKATIGGRLDQSRHYKKQSPLAGSIREMRGRIVRRLTIGPSRIDDLKHAVVADERFEAALNSLQAEGLVVMRHELWQLDSDRG